MVTITSRNIPAQGSTVSEDWLMLQFEDNCKLYFKGDCQKALAFVSVSLFGTVSDEACQRLTAEITRILKEALGIEPDGIYVRYAQTPLWGWNGSNF